MGKRFGLETLRAKYAASDQHFNAEELAHLVSCRSCLDQANGILELLPLDERSPDETIDRNTPPGNVSPDTQAEVLGAPVYSTTATGTPTRRRHLFRASGVEHIRALVRHRC